MFEGFKAKREAARAAQQQQTASTTAQQTFASWQQERENAQQLVTIATAEGTVPDGVALHRGELCFGTLSNCSLVEERRGQGHFASGNAGVSIPIGNLGGRPIRYRVGASRGHFIQGVPSPTAIATGTLYITNQRFVFLSTTQTRECRYDHLVGVQRDDTEGSMTISISNRQHPVVLHYGPDVASWVDFRSELGLSHYRGDTDALVAKLNQQIADLDAAQPANPNPVTAPT